MILLSRYDGVPTNIERAKNQFARFVEKFKQRDFFVFPFQHLGYLTLRKIENGKYKNCYGTFQSSTKPKKYIEIIKIKKVARF